MTLENLMGLLLGMLIGALLFYVLTYCMIALGKFDKLYNWLRNRFK